MKAITARIEQIYGVSGKLLLWLNRTMGTRDYEAPPLAAAKRLQFSRSLRVWIAAVILTSGAFAFLVNYIRLTVDQSLASAVPVPSLEDLHAYWHWTTLGSFALALVLIGLSWWAVTMRTHYRLRASFIWIPLLIALACASFRPIGRLAVEMRLMALFTRGLTLFEEKKWEDCYTYYSRLYYIFPSTVVSDNCLGRMAGAHYHQGNYGRAVRDYVRLLTAFPGSDIEKPVRRSIEWAMTRLGNEESAENCAAIYDKYGLQSLGFSAFGFYLDAPRHAEAAHPQLFGSMGGGGEFTQNLRTFLALYPQDTWAARAAFFLGDAELMARYPQSSYYTAYGIVEGWHLQNRQSYAEAAVRYEAFIKAHPRTAEAQATRELLARCYLSASELEDALAQLMSQAGNTATVPAALYFLYLERFAFLDDINRAAALFQSMKGRLPARLAADMALLLRERLVLEGAGSADERAELERFAQRSVLLSRSPAAEDFYSSVGEFIHAHFYYGDDLARFVNTRLRQSSGDVLFQHYIDRNYVQSGPIWPDSGKKSYTQLLQELVDRTLAEKLALSSSADFAAHLGKLHRALKDPSLLHSATKALCERMLAANETADVATLRILNGVVDGDQRAAFEQLALNTLKKAPVDRTGVQTGLSIHELVSTDETGAALATLAEKHLHRDGTRKAVDDLVAAIRKSPRRTSLISRLGTQLTAAYVRVAGADRAVTQSQMIQLGLLGLQNRQTYHVSRATFTNYLQLWPEHTLASNMMMWLAWLDCFEAYEAAADPTQFRAAYERARDNYQRVANTTEQLRVKFMALESERVIGRKLKLMEVGLRRSDELPIPEEIVLWGEPRERLSGTVWDCEANGQTVGRVVFRGTKVNFSTNHGPVTADYHLAIDDAGRMNVAASAQLDESMLLANMVITHGQMALRFMMIDAQGKSATTSVQGALRSGTIAAPRPERLPHP